MKKLITILGAGLLAFGMLTSCGAKDVNLSWSDEATSYGYVCDVTAGTITDINEAESYSDAEAAKTFLQNYTVSNEVTFNWARVSWSDGYRGDQATKTESNAAQYRIVLNYDMTSTITNKTTSDVENKSYERGNEVTFDIYKIGDKYYINSGADNQAEVTIEGDIEDDEFTFSVDRFFVKYVDDWKADGTTNFYKGDNEAVQKAVKTYGYNRNTGNYDIPSLSFSGIKVVRK